MQAARRVFLNTGFLYGKMVLHFVIALYSTRLILQALGITDFGIFNLVAGVIAMLYFLNSAMATATQRYMSFYLGAGEINQIKGVFRTSVLLHLVIGIIVVVALEVLGLFIFDGFLNIPTQRMPAAKIVFQLMIVSTFFTINAVPYDAAINARENMLYDAIMGVVESIAKLGIAIWLIYSHSDKLIFYASAIAALTILIRIAKTLYCRYHYEECRISLLGPINIQLGKSMFSFAGWNLFGALCNVSRDQGMAIVLNLFFGTIVNAAYGVANQVNGQLLSFSSTLSKAINPQIVKSEGRGDRNRMLRLTITTCKMSFFLLSFFALPLIIEMPFVLNLWLDEVPEHAIIFCRLIIGLSLVSQLSRGLQIALQAVGKIRAYQVVVGTLIILNLPLAYVLVNAGLQPFSVFVGAIFIEVIAGGLRMWFAHRLTGLSMPTFFKEVWLNASISILIASALACLPTYLMKESFYRLLLTGSISAVTIPLIAYYIALSKTETDKIKEICLSFVTKTRKKLIKHPI